MRRKSTALCFSHKIQDMESICNFLTRWASFATKSEEDTSPEYNIECVYPPLDLPFLRQQKPAKEMKNCAFTRVIFDAENISKLKEMAADKVKNPTRVEVVASLLYKSAISAAAKASPSSVLKSTSMHHVMNLRTKVSPLLSAGSTGNLTGVFPVSTEEDTEAELGWLVKEFRREKTQFSDTCGEIHNNDQELYKFILKNMEGMGNYFSDENEQVYFCSSWCRYPFYEADFGWGKPSWATTVFWEMKNLILMIDTKGDGVEALVTLDQKAMSLFENDQLLLSFSTINPSVFQ